MIKTTTKLLLTSAVFLLIQGCAPKGYIVKAPVTSNVNYELATSLAGKNIALTDLREDTDKKFSTGILNAELYTAKDNALDPINYLKQNTELELLSRGIPVSLDNGDALNVDINSVFMKNHRVSGFSPFVTFTMLSADVMVADKKEPIAVFIRRGKVPVWSFDEIIEPTLNEPLSLLVKEFAAKINSTVYKQQISDESVVKLSNKIKAGGDYLDVYQLGFGNNPSAIEYLKELTESTDEYIRQAAISSLGILKAEGEFEYLKSLYQTGKSWSDRAMALKAIGDLRTESGIAFLREEQKSFIDDKKKFWVNDLVNLYL